MPSSKKVDSLGILFLKLCILNGEKSVNDVLGDWGECLFTNSGANNSDCLNDLSTELLVLNGAEFLQCTEQEIE